MIRTEDKAVTLVCLDHIGKLCCENVVAAILALFLPCCRVNVLDRQIPVECLWVELALCWLTSLEVNNGRNFDITCVLRCVGLLSIGWRLPTFRVTFPRAIFSVWDSRLVDQNIDIGEKLDFATATEVRRSRSEHSLILNGIHATCHDSL